MELYIHIPFCVRKCAYCDFLSAPADQDTMGHYMECLEKQLVRQAASFQKKEIDTVFIGGGTPTILRIEQLSRLLAAVRERFVLAAGAEITVEANPGTITAGKARALADGGVNRVSLGLQSASERELRLLGRIHTYDDFLRSYGLVREAGIRNVNVDLMSALPGQTIASYEKTLHQVLSLHPEHISAYSLIIEEGTPFYEQYREDEKLRDAGEEPHVLPSEESERAMYELTGALLSDYGYDRYEISNYAKAGYACRHNIGYWDQTPYLGLGLGASSYMDEIRFKNTSDMKDYLCQAKAGVFRREEEEILTLKNRMEECMFLGLRMTKGVGFAEFQEKFGVSMMSVYGKTIEHFVREKLLTIRENRVCLTEKGMDLANTVMAEFLL